MCRFKKNVKLQKATNKKSMEEIFTFTKSALRCFLEYYFLWMVGRNTSGEYFAAVRVLNSIPTSVGGWKCLLSLWQGEICPRVFVVVSRGLVLWVVLFCLFALFFPLLFLQLLYFLGDIPHQAEIARNWEKGLVDKGV